MNEEGYIVKKAIKCSRCPDYYFGDRENDKNKICLKCVNAIKKYTQENDKINQQYFKTTGKGRL